mmetsp:Transcript_11398/g.19230  ORF Transcript_11398/g.19230 Transcript_11398/m.19230 type:complete len:131 (-) Transcript_11398:820-1212(-)
MRPLDKKVQIIAFVNKVHQIYGLNALECVKEAWLSGETESLNLVSLLTHLSKIIIQQRDKTVIDITGGASQSNSQARFARSGLVMQKLGNGKGAGEELEGLRGLDSEYLEDPLLSTVLDALVALSESGLL